jgi:ATP-binding cassette subfamily B protein
MQMDFTHWMALESAMQGDQPGRGFSRETLRRVVRFARPHRRSLVAFLLLSVAAAVLTVATPVRACSCSPV